MSYRYFSLILLSLFLCHAVAAKTTRKKYILKSDAGIKGGQSFNNMHGNGWPRDYSSNFHGGIMYGLREHIFGVQAEGMINTAIYNPESIKNVYLDVPVMFQFLLFDRVWFQVGPQYSFLLSSHYISSDRATNMFTPGGFSVAGGVQFILSRHWRMGMRYAYGITSWDNTGSETWHTRSTQLYLGLTL